MKKQVVVIGLGRFGSSLARTLYEIGHDVLAIDSNEKSVQNLVGHATYAVQADATDEAALKELGVSNFEVGVVAVGSEIQVSVMATVLLKRLGIPYVIARARSELHAQTLEKVGADRVVLTESEMGERVAHSMANPDVLDYMSVSPSYGVSKVKPPDKFIGQTLEDVELGPKSKYGISVLVIKRGNDMIVNPDRFERIENGDIFIVVGKDDQMERLRSS